MQRAGASAPAGRLRAGARAIPSPDGAPLRPPLSHPLAMPSRLLLLLALLLPVAGCGDDTAADAGDATGGEGGEAVDDAAPPAGTYRAYFVFTGPGGVDTTEAVEGALSAPIPADAGTAFELPAHSQNVRVANTTWPLPDGLADASYLLSYREPDGDLVVYGSDFSTPRFCNVDSADAAMRAIPVGPMWTSEAPSHPVTVFDVSGNDTLGVFTLTRPADAMAHVTQLTAGDAAGQQAVRLHVEAHWADGRERRMVMMWRAASGDWWGSALEPDASAVVGDGEQAYENAFGIGEDHPAVFLVALDE